MTRFALNRIPSHGGAGLVAERCRTARLQKVHRQSWEPWLKGGGLALGHFVVRQLPASRVTDGVEGLRVVLLQVDVGMRIPR
jgi:hypothetical protein